MVRNRIPYIQNRLTIFLAIILPVFLVTCSDDKSTNPDENAKDYKEIVILYTNDEHGWMEESETTEGAARLMGLWRAEEEFTEDGGYLILSGGDNWTGPAISTWFKGESMVAVMNAMNYSAAAIGNHEFDFTVEGLTERIAQADFPYLSANIRTKSSGAIPAFAQPYVILEVNDVKVGIIGLTSTSTPYSAFPDYVKDYDFISYADALEEIFPQIEDSAEVFIVIGHICQSEMQSLVPLANTLGIQVITGGHCNEYLGAIVDGVTLLEGGSHLRGYAKVKISYNPETGTIESLEPSVHENTGGAPDPAVEGVVTYWRDQADAELSEVIGYTENGIPQYSNAMYNMVTDSWLFSYPQADISMTNIGGIRQSILAGNITIGTIIGVLPFENNIVELELTGSQVINCLGNLVIGGMTAIAGYYLANGTSLAADSIYEVLTTDYLYAVSYTNFSSYDSDPYYTSMNYHQPTIDWIISRKTSPANPLDDYLDHDPRR